MLKFFRTIRRKLIDKGNLKRYLIYTIGEIFLVMIGILLALQVNNWNENNKDRKVENKLLIELKENLNFNQNRLQDEILKEHSSIKSINLVVEHIDNRKPYHDSLDTYFRQAFRAYDIVISSSAFEAIKSKGFELIQSDSLRKEIVGLYDETYSNLISETVRLENQFWSSSVLPIWHTHFRMIGNTLKPVDYEALLNDKTYINMITNRRHLREVAIQNKSESLLRTEFLLTHIDNYLGLTEN
ncbi:DUF6090 family protein [Algoriphagus sp. SE2]|uniref:DUF6090 family protein n=1 Tax=Algoriphagus sp. SE2 TaxID=3141536 RepID=UPI0031CD272E